MTNGRGQQYSWLGSIVYFAQLVFQPRKHHPTPISFVPRATLIVVSVWALVRLPVNWWILFCFFGWGASCMICAAFTSFPGLLVFRFSLGACEASISPSMLIIVSMWWTRREQPLRNKYVILSPLRQQLTLQHLVFCQWNRFDFGFAIGVWSGSH